MYKLILEAFFVGLMNYSSSFLFDFSKRCNIFFMGVFIHLMCEMTGLNKVYCSYGYACNVER